MPVCELTKYAILTSAHAINQPPYSKPPKPYPPSVLLEGLPKPAQGHSYGSIYGTVMLFQFRPENCPEDDYIYLGVGRFYIEEWQEPTYMPDWQTGVTTSNHYSDGFGGSATTYNTNTTKMIIKISRRACIETLIGGPVPEEESLYHIPLFRSILWENRGTLVCRDGIPADEIVNLAYSVLQATKSQDGKVMLPENMKGIESGSDIVLAKDLKNLKPFEIYLAEPTGDRLRDVVREL